MEERFSLRLVFPTASQGNALLQADKVRGLTTSQARGPIRREQNLNYPAHACRNQAGKPGV